MRIRSTKPEFWRSKTIAQLDWATRLVLKGLESYVDDNGVGKDDIALIAADVFPRDLSANPPDTLARLSEAISELARKGLIVRYVVDGEDLLYIVNWKELQRIDKPAKGRFPRPDGTIEYSEPVNRDSYGNTPDTLATSPDILAPVTGEQGNRGTGNRGTDLTPRAKAAPGQAKTKEPRGCRLPEGWEPPDELIRKMREECPSLDLRAEHRIFADYWLAQPGTKGRKADWEATWRNWMRRAAERAPAPAVNGRRLQGADAKAAEWQAMKASEVQGEHGD
jgi:hypothetical protein